MLVGLVALYALAAVIIIKVVAPEVTDCTRSRP
jgi:hypothetical protein